MISAEKSLWIDMMELISKQKIEIELDSCKMEPWKSKVKGRWQAQNTELLFLIRYTTWLDCGEWWRIGHMYSFLSKEMKDEWGIKYWDLGDTSRGSWWQFKGIEE